MGILKIVFPLLMVAGALGSLVVSIDSKGDWATTDKTLEAKATEAWNRRADNG